MIRFQHAICPACKGRVGITFLGPRDVRAVLLTKPLHRCRRPTLGERIDSYFDAAAEKHDAIFGRPMDLLQSIVGRASAPGEDLHGALDAIKSYAQQALLALAAGRPNNPLR
jgi:hypothetical protein